MMKVFHNVCCCSVAHSWLFETPWTAACQASLSFMISRSLLKLMSIESVMPSNHLILCHPLLLLPWIFFHIRVFSNDLALPIKGSKYWSFSFFQWIFRADFSEDQLVWSPCCSNDSQEQLSSNTVQNHQFLGAQLSLWSHSHNHWEDKSNQHVIHLKLSQCYMSITSQ